MNIRITDKAEAELSKIEAKTFRITFDEDCGWASMAYSLVLDEPEEDDVITLVQDRTFLVEDELAEIVDSFEIDFHKGWIRRAFVIYANEER